LSGGEQQMLAIARALLLNPRLLLLDEPSDGLAPSVVARVAGLLRDLRDQGLAVLLVEQDLRTAFAVAGEVAVRARARSPTAPPPSSSATTPLWRPACSGSSGSGAEGRGVGGSGTRVRAPCTHLALDEPYLAPGEPHPPGRPGRGPPEGERSRSPELGDRAVHSPTPRATSGPCGWRRRGGWSRR
ncbi:MAG TPA: ATP-binding cassette domain-containing protein, partial [Actinomycetota bacterium]|nr:ATP-binding cassette domain-containing protein [Actinomycetota bacterium]